MNCQLPLPLQTRSVLLRVGTGTGLLLPCALCVQMSNVQCRMSARLLPTAILAVLNLVSGQDFEPRICLDHVGWTAVDSDIRFGQLTCYLDSANSLWVRRSNVRKAPYI
jgi:hypothetical protein